MVIHKTLLALKDSLGWLIPNGPNGEDHDRIETTVIGFTETLVDAR